MRVNPVFAKCEGKARAVLEALLAKYADESVLNLDDDNVLRNPPLNMLGTPLELVRAFGSKGGFEAAVRSVVDLLYDEAG